MNFNNPDIKADEDKIEKEFFDDIKPHKTYSRTLKLLELKNRNTSLKTFLKYYKKKIKCKSLIQREFNLDKEPTKNMYQTYYYNYQVFNPIEFMKKIQINEKKNIQKKEEKKFKRNFSQYFNSTQYEKIKRNTKRKIELIKEINKLPIFQNPPIGRYNINYESISSKVKSFSMDKTIHKEKSSVNSIIEKNDKNKKKPKLRIILLDLKEKQKSNLNKNSKLNYLLESNSNSNREIDPLNLFKKRIILNKKIKTKKLIISSSSNSNNNNSLNFRKSLSLHDIFLQSKNKTNKYYKK